MSDDNQFLADGAGNPTLGPNYFAGRAIAERFTAQFKDEHFKPLIDNFVAQFQDALWEKSRDWFLSDLESNLQLDIWRRIDRSVEAILSGEEWALRLYAIKPNYDGDKIRAAIAKHIPAAIIDARIADLEAENKRLTEDVENLRRRY